MFHWYFFHHIVVPPYPPCDAIIQIDFWHLIGDE